MAKEKPETKDIPVTKPKTKAKPVTKTVKASTWVEIDEDTKVKPFGRGLLVKVEGESVIYVPQVALAMRNNEKVIRPILR